MVTDTGTTLILSLLFAGALNIVCLSPPGKPKLTVCRSPEKETFTCWWEPGFDGGLLTNHSLLYRKENSDTVYECPDYHTAGRNSCFFSKNNTSLWVNYNITVVATNILGSNFSDPVDVDVVYIVQPHTPENVTVVLEGDDNPFLVVKWEPPRQADTRSGWITLVYQLRIKLQKGNEWEELFAGQQKRFNIFSLHSGETYMVQARCKPDHGFWSEWSPTTYIQIPYYIPREKSAWILTAAFIVFILLIVFWTAHVKRKSVKHFLLPPVPGPKIKGFDAQQLKSGKPDELFSTLVVQGFPPLPDYQDLLVEYLEVYDNEDQELVHCRKDLKTQSSSDRDSGRGSCDSSSLLMETCSEPVEVKNNESGVGVEKAADSCVSESANVKTGTRPTISSYPDDAKPFYHSIPEASRQCPAPKCHFPPSRQQDCWKNPSEAKHSKPSTGHQCIDTYSDFNVNSIAERQATVPSSKSMEYVEVQRVNQTNTLILKPIAQEWMGTLHLEFTGQDYSRVNGVVSDSVLLLQREVASQCLGDCQEAVAPGKDCDQQLTPKPSVHQQVALTGEGLHLASNGYVETVASLASH